MTRRFHRTLVLATALALGPVAQARAQDVDLRSLDNSGGFPTSPTTAPTVSPESNATPPATDGAAAQDPAGEPAPDRTAQDQTPQDPGADDQDAPSDGKRKPKKAKLYRPDPKVSPPLSPLVPYRGAAGPQHRVLNPKPSQEQVDPPQPAPTIAVIESPPLPKRPAVDLDPFAPTGVEVGALRMLPFVETTAGYETNPNQASVGVKPSAALRVDGGFDLDSDFSNHSFAANLRAGYSEFPSNSAASRPDASGTVDGRIDVTRNDQINVEGRFTLATQTPGSALLSVPNAATTQDRPLVVSEGATIGATHVFNRLSLGLRSTIDRTQYGDATNSDGSITRYSQENYNDYGIVARAAYEVTPALIPFSEVGFDTRVRDNPVDLSGYRRDSVGGTARVGSTIELSRLLTGSISGGYLERHYSDPRLANLKGPTLDAALAYAATPLTTISFQATTTASETTLPGASGAIARQFTLQVAHTFFRNFTLTGIATYQPNEYQGVNVNEHFITLTLKGAYSITRDVQLIASASHQSLSSTVQSNNFTDNVFLAGVRLQR